jgi:T-complex protein 1 subunit beta
LLKQAELLIAMRIHPQTIVAGFRRALTIAQNALRASAMASDACASPFPSFMKGDWGICRKNAEDLLKIARTSLGSKILAQHKDHFAKLAVDAVMRLRGSGNLDAIQIIKKLGGSLVESYLDEGEGRRESVMCQAFCSRNDPECISRNASSRPRF